MLILPLIPLLKQGLFNNGMSGKIIQNKNAIQRKITLIRR